MITGTPIVRFVQAHPDAVKPVYTTLEAAGADLTAVEEATLYKGCWAAVRTGLIMAIPSGFEGQIRPRSGLALKHGVTVLNAPGTIDADYRGEVKVILINHGASTFVVEKGMRIAQLLIVPVSRAVFIVAKDLDDTTRGSGGFGSTGK